MKRNSLWALVVSLSLAGSAFGLNIGDKAPDTTVKMKNVDGNEVSIADVAGKNGTLVVFTCNHCPFAKAWQDSVALIGNAAKGKGVGVMVINSNDPTDNPEDSYSEMQKAAQTLGFTFPYVVDATSDVARAFGATRTPEAFLFDKDGKLVYHGAIDSQGARAVMQSLAGSAFRLNIGDKAPDTTVKMRNVDGKELSIADVTGKNGTLVVFTCNHCPFAKAWEERIASIGNAAKDKGVGVIAINSNDPTDYPEDSYSEMQKRAQKLGFAFPYVVDATSDVARAFDATRTPEAFLFDKDGKLVYHGAIDDSQDASAVKDHFLQDAIDASTAGKQVANKETKFVGCGIKFHAKT